MVGIEWPWKLTGFLLGESVWLVLPVWNVLLSFLRIGWRSTLLCVLYKIKNRAILRRRERNELMYNSGSGGACSACWRTFRMKPHPTDRRSYGRWEWGVGTIRPIMSRQYYVLLVVMVWYQGPSLPQTDSSGAYRWRQPRFTYQILFLLIRPKIP